MKRTILGITIIILLVLTGCLSNGNSNEPIAEAPVNYVKQVDHIILAPDNAEELYNLFLNNFELQLAWPYDNYGGEMSGGVQLGNANLSIAQLDDSAEHGIVGIAFAPSTDCFEAKEGLEARGISCGEPMVYEGYWTELYTYGVLNSADIYFCDYHFPNEISISHGNPAQIKSIGEITISAIDYEAALDGWSRLFGPLEPTKPGYWGIGYGPSIRLIAGDQDKIQSIQFEVRSLETAEAFLEEQGLLGARLEDSVFTEPAASNQILFEFKESQ